MLAKIPIQLRLADNECDLLDRYRREQRNPPSRAEAAKEVLLRTLRDRLGEIETEGSIHAA